MSLTPNYSHLSLYSNSVIYSLGLSLLPYVKYPLSDQNISSTHSLISWPLHWITDLSENCFLFSKNVPSLPRDPIPRLHGASPQPLSFFLALWLCYTCASKPPQWITSNHVYLLLVHMGCWCSCWKPSSHEDWCHHKGVEFNHSCSLHLQCSPVPSQALPSFPSAIFPNCHHSP